MRRLQSVADGILILDQIRGLLVMHVEQASVFVVWVVEHQIRPDLSPTPRPKHDSRRKNVFFNIKYLKNKKHGPIQLCTLPTHNRRERLLVMNVQQTSARIPDDDVARSEEILMLHRGQPNPETKVSRPFHLRSKAQERNACERAARDAALGRGSFVQRSP